MAKWTWITSLFRVNLFFSCGKIDLTNKLQRSKEDNNDGEWVNATASAQNSFTINIGDMIHVWSGGKYSAPEHRVIASDKWARYSIPFFYNPNYEAVIKPLSGLEVKQNYRPFTWAEFRAARFKGDYADIGRETQIEDWEIPI